MENYQSRVSILMDIVLAHPPDIINRVYIHYGNTEVNGNYWTLKKLGFDEGVNNSFITIVTAPIMYALSPNEPIPTRAFFDEVGKQRSLIIS